LDALYIAPSARRRYLRWWRLRRRPASFEKLRILLLAVVREPVDVQELCQGALDGGIVEPQGNEAALLVQRVAKPEGAGLQLRPVRPEGIGRTTALSLVLWLRKTSNSNSADMDGRLKHGAATARVFQQRLRAGTIANSATSRGGDYTKRRRNGSASLGALRRGPQRRRGIDPFASTHASTHPEKNRGHMGPDGSTPKPHGTGEKPGFAHMGSPLGPNGSRSLNLRVNETR